MNYQKHYNLFVEKARSRNLTKPQYKALGIYVEDHHIIPDCMGGPDSPDNLVFLLAEEHYVAHQLLVKMYPEHGRLIYAAIKMTINSKYHKRINNKSYSWLKKKFSKEHSERMKGNQFGKGVKKSQETIEKTRKKNLGKKRTEEQNKKQSESHKGIKHTEETIEKLRIIALSREKVTCPHCSESGNGPFYSYHFDNCLKNPNITQAQIDSRKKTNRVKCPHCEKIGSLGSMSKWHFDNCLKNPNITQEQLDNRKQKTVTCPHCGTTGGSTMLKVWHFDNCPHNPEQPDNRKQKTVTCPHCGTTGVERNMKQWHFDKCRKIVL